MFYENRTLNWGRHLTPGTFDTVWIHFWFSLLRREFFWYLEGPGHLLAVIRSGFGSCPVQGPAACLMDAPV